LLKWDSRYICQVHILLSFSILYNLFDLVGVELQMLFSKLYSHAKRFTSHSLNKNAPLFSGRNLRVSMPVPRQYLSTLHPHGSCDDHNNLLNNPYLHHCPSVKRMALREICTDEEWSQWADFAHGRRVLDV
jgi:hypothetical protein